MSHEADDDSMRGQIKDVKTKDEVVANPTDQYMGVGLAGGKIHIPYW